MTFTFPKSTQRQAVKQGLVLFECGTPCPCCGDVRRYRLKSNYLCWTCYLGEDYLTKPKTSCASINKSLKHLEAKEKKHLRVLVATGFTKKGKVGSRIGCV